MSIQSIRLQANDPDLHFATVDKAEAEALCDLADVVRARHRKHGCMECDFDDPCAVAAALARLDGETDR